ncbi:hypothetical protein GCM10017557_82270 [Streptomyces aurantiacus]|uniref:Uncharacterized protein n=1 Tax=Streptomyces aurantiacus TaxID=47760 RepID=A0A7G1PD82_9ACTN|nr:hypothetical protein GCM10017557_82270 [Streptomyces aurantiacus]
MGRTEATYDHGLLAGWLIAGGAVEGAARHLVADRLDITGSRWTVPGAEAVLTLRTVISNGDFPDCWIFHTRKENERLHPSPDQHIYALPTGPGTHSGRAAPEEEGAGRAYGRTSGDRVPGARASAGLRASPSTHRDLTPFVNTGEMAYPWNGVFTGNDEDMSICCEGGSP